MVGARIFLVAFIVRTTITMWGGRAGFRHTEGDGGDRERRKRCDKSHGTARDESECAFARRGRLAELVELVDKTLQRSECGAGGILRLLDLFRFAVFRDLLFLFGERLRPLGKLVV